MRVGLFAVLAGAVAIAACNDAQSPLGLDSTAAPVQAGLQAHFSRGDCRDDHRDRYGRRDHDDCDRSSGYNTPSPRDGHDGHDGHDCNKPDTSGTGSISGTVKNNAEVVSGYPIFLLSPNGTTVVANTTTTANGTYTFTGVKTGAYLVCEANPFVPEWGMLAETQPQTGPACSGTAYAPVGYSVTVTKGATASGNDFANFGLE
jgi:hypothetical protein